MIKLNPDNNKFKEIRKALNENDGYCTCRIVKTEDTKCMYKESREQKSGYCHCELYYKV